MKTALDVRAIIGNAIMMILAMAVASWALWPIYQSTQFIIMVSVSIATTILITTVGASLRWPGIAVAALTVIAYLTLGVPLAIPGRAISGILPSLDGIQELIVATAVAWKQLLTITLPVGSYQALLVPAFVLVLVTTTVGMWVLIRSNRPAPGMLAPVAIFLAGIAFGPGEGSFPIVKGLALLGVLTAWHIWFRWHRRAVAIKRFSVHGPAVQPAQKTRSASWRSFASAAAILAVAVAGGASVASALPSNNERDVLRSHIVQPFDPRAYPSPLAGFRKYLQPALAGEPMLTVTGLPEDGYLRIATLDTYDGIVYSVGSDRIASDSGTFTRVPYRLDQSGSGGEEVQLEVTIDGYTGQWVPGVGKLAEISFMGPNEDRLSNTFFYNDTTGTAAVIAGLDRGDSYRTTNVVAPFASMDELREAVPGTATLPPIQVLPDELANNLTRFAPAGLAPGDRLVRMLQALKSNGYVSHGVSEDEPYSRSGHSADRITQLLTDKPMLGDQEQYAVTAALMARQLGFPARVVVGFAAPEGRDPSTSVTFTGADVSAWIEVQTGENGWLSIDPTPQLRDVPAKHPDEPTKVSRPESVVQPPPGEQLDQQQQSAPESVQEDEAPPPEPWLLLLAQIAQILGWTGLGLLLVLSPFLFIIAAKLRRRRLRRKPRSALQRISGGWQEFEDNVRDHGFDVPTAATRSEVATTVGGMRPLVLASVADRAVFAPFAPSDAEADRVWSAVSDLRASLSVGKTRWQRVKALISVRSFDSYHGRRKE